MRSIENTIRDYFYTFVITSIFFLHSSLNTSHTAGAIAMVFTVCVVMMVLNVSDVMFTSERQSVMFGQGSSVD